MIRAGARGPSIKRTLWYHCASIRKTASDHGAFARRTDPRRKSNLTSDEQIKRASTTGSLAVDVDQDLIVIVVAKTLHHGSTYATKRTPANRSAFCPELMRTPADAPPK